MQTSTFFKFKTTLFIGCFALMFLSSQAAFADEIYCAVCGNYIEGEYFSDDSGTAICPSHMHNGEVAFCNTCGLFSTNFLHMENGSNICYNCYENADICHICKGIITGEYFFDMYDNKVCASHIQSGDVDKCFNCQEYILKEVVFDDGRIICNTCLATAVKVGDDVNGIFGEVVSVMKGFGFDVSQYDVSIVVLNAKYLAEYTEQDVSETRLGTANTVTEEEQLPSGEVRITRKHTIYLLDYQPRLRFASTLAHELMHVWQEENGVTPELKYCEGLSNFSEYLYLSRINDIEANKQIALLMADEDAIYGDGFRAVYNASRTQGFDKLIRSYLNNDYSIFE